MSSSPAQSDASVSPNNMDEVVEEVRAEEVEVEVEEANVLPNNIEEE